MKISLKDKIMRGAFMRHRRTTKRNLFLYLTKINKNHMFASAEQHTKWWRKTHYYEYTN